MSTPTPNVTILIVNYNAGEHLRSCIRALTVQTYDKFEVIIIDNASRDDSIAEARDVIGDDQRFSVECLSENIGFAAANNHGAAHARGAWLATLNPDAFPEPGWLDALVRESAQHPDVVMFGSTQRDAANPARFDGTGDRYLAPGIPWRDKTATRLEHSRAAGQQTYETFSPCAAAAMYRADVFQAHGGFDESFFCFVEDVDLAFRLRRAGHRCLQVTDAVVHHVGGGSGGDRASDFVRYHGVRNLIWCFAKNMPGILLILMAPLHALALLYLLVDGARHGYGAAIGRGIRDGLASAARIRRASSLPENGMAAPVGRAFDWNILPYLRQRSARSGS